MPYPSFKSDLDQAIDPLVVALDVGSTACRGAVYDAAGRPVVKRTKVAHQFTTDSAGTSTIDPDQVVDELGRILDALTEQDLAGRVGGVALDTFASSLVGVDEDGNAITPCYTYADSRCSAEVDELRGKLDEAEVQQRTGTRLHTSYLTPRLMWLRNTEPALFERAARWLSLGEYVLLRWLGTTACGTSTAAWTGMLDRRARAWDTRMLRLAGVRKDQMSPIHNPDETLSPETDLVAGRWPALADARWFPPVPDGIASNIGTGAFDSSTIVAGMSTSGAMRVLVRDVPETIPSGLWCYRIDEERSLLGGALNDVGRAVTWLKDTLRLEGAGGDANGADAGGERGEGGDADKGDADAAIEAALLADPTPGTPLVLPFFTGERSTGWASGARAVFAGVTASTTPADLARGTAEGVALSYRRVAEQLQEVAGDVTAIRASGRVPAAAPALLRVLADALQAPVLPVTIKRSTLHGTALLALEVLAPDVERAEVDLGPWNDPIVRHQEYYDDRAARFAALYDAVIG